MGCFDIGLILWAAASDLNSETRVANDSAAIVRSRDMKFFRLVMIPSDE
jgi:hypothetical protein